MHRVPVPGASSGFWMGGFEGADHINMHGQALDMNALSGHIELLEEDYSRMSQLQLGTVRESVGWRICSEHVGTDQRYNFGRLRRMAAAAERHGLRVQWTLMHYGLPADVQLTGADFVARFAEFAALAAREIRRVRSVPSVYTPINEIGFLAWAYTRAHLIGARQGGDALELDGFDVKCRLVSAALAAVAAIRREDPGATFLQVEPLIHVTTAADRPDLAEGAAIFTQYQWQAWDLMLGRLRPELGGSENAVDLIGVNHYHDSQWELPTGQPLQWNPPDPRRRALADLLHETWQRYDRPLLVAETSHVGAGRVAWLDMVAKQALQASARAVPLQGICLYPVADRPDWNDGTHWHRCGLWDCGEGADARLQRRPVTAYLNALRSHQHTVREHLSQGIASRALSRTA